MDRVADAGLPGAQGRAWVKRSSRDLWSMRQKRAHQSIMLGVVEENKAAYRFWQQLGFELVRTTRTARIRRKKYT